jgi:hypothetical protein
MIYKHSVYGNRTNERSQSTWTEVTAHHLSSYLLSCLASCILRPISLISSFPTSPFLSACCCFSSSASYYRQHRRFDPVMRHDLIWCTRYTITRHVELYATKRPSDGLACCLSAAATCTFSSDSHPTPPLIPFIAYNQSTYALVVN